MATSSSTGCLPFYKMWKCDPKNENFHESCKAISSGTLFLFLDIWLSLCGLDEGQSELCYKEAFRLEVFDRLGMAHTCCGHQKSFMDENDQKQLREEDEDSELKEQLDTIIQVYQNRYTKHSGGLKDFWKGIVQDLDGILPELIPEERCRYHCLSWREYRDYGSSKERELHDLRMAKEKEALAKKDYLGLDFIDSSMSFVSTSQILLLGSTRNCTIMGSAPLLI